VTGNYLDTVTDYLSENFNLEQACVIMNKAVNECQAFPSIRVLRDIASKCNFGVTSTKAVGCDPCDMAGFYVVVNPENGREAVAACVCDLGKYYQQKGYIDRVQAARRGYKLTASQYRNHRRAVHAKRVSSSSPT
jgi:hypothetical protein